MSAICGFIQLDGAPADAELLRVQMARLRHRGPDGEGSMTDAVVALGHQLLSITPESAQETSPWRSRDGQLAIAFDGRLDHLEDLWAALNLAAGERSEPDPALVLRAYEKWGEGCVDALAGEFAFALWDRRERRLFCARDRMGLRDFYYHAGSRRFVFGSEIKALFPVPGVPRELDEFTFGCRLAVIPNPRPRTLYRDIHELLPAQTVTLRVGEAPRFRRYWRLMMAPEIRLRSPADYVEALREKLEASVRSAMRSRHPVGAMLSGGLDSTGVASLVARELARSGSTLATFSNVLPDGPAALHANGDERAFIDAALEKYPNMQPQWALGRMFPVVEFDDAVLARNDEPFGDVWSFYTAELAALAHGMGVRVMLGGLAGDMAVSLRGDGVLEYLVRRGRWLEAGRQMQSRFRLGVGGRRRIFGREVLFPLVPSTLWKGLRRFRTAPPRDTAIHPDFAARLGLDDYWRQLGRDDTRVADARRRLVRRSDSGKPFVSHLWCAAHRPGIECPQPWLDHRLWEWTYRVPLIEFCREGMPRGLYREAMRGVLPEKVRCRTSKGPFAPEFRSRLVECAPRIREFLDRYPANNPIWARLHRPTVEAQLARLAEPEIERDRGADLQTVLVHSLRQAHFFLWLKGDR